MTKRPDHESCDMSGEDSTGDDFSGSGEDCKHHRHSQTHKTKKHQHKQRSHRDMCDFCGLPDLDCHCRDKHHHSKCCAPHALHHGHLHTCPPVHHPFFKFFCDDRIRMNLAGLAGNLNFQFLRLKGCQVKIKFECAGQEREVEGCICGAGVDNVDIKQENNTVTTVLTQRICTVEWKDANCNPCAPCPPVPCPPHGGFPHNPCGAC